MATDKTHFRTSLSGFNKADVLEYLDKQNADFREESRRTAAAIEEKTKKIDALTEENEKLKAELEELRKKSEESAAEAETAKEELAAAKQALSESEAVIASQTELIDTLKKSAEHEDEDPGKNAETERKAELYDGVSSQVGDILITANKSADAIIAQAGAEAKEKRDSFDRIVSGCADGLKKDADGITEEYKAGIEAELKEAEGRLAAALEDIRKTSERISALTGTARAKLGEKLGAALCCMDGKLKEFKTE